MNMELNNIDLPPLLIVDLYRKTFVEIDEVKTNHQDSSDENDEWKFLGENLKNISIIVNYKDATHLYDKQLEFLVTMLSACKLSLEDVSIININNYPDKKYKELTGYFKSKIIFLFDVDPVSFGLPVRFPHFQVQQFSMSTFLFLPTLKEIQNDEVLKSKLWVCLRRIFEI